MLKLAPECVLESLELPEVWIRVLPASPLVRNESCNPHPVAERDDFTTSLQDQGRF